MALVPVPGNVAKVSETVDGLAIEIPAKRSILLLVFLSFWLCGWAWGEISVSKQLLNSKAGDAADLLLIAWLGMWTIGGGFAIYTWAWMVLGKERLLLGGSTLSIVRDLAGFKMTKEYDLTHVANLRVTAERSSLFDAGSTLQFWGLSGGTITFDYGAKTFRVGASLEAAEAKRLCEQLIRRTPSLGAASAA